MVDIVPAEDIERIVGHARTQSVHIGRAVSVEETLYVLHSQSCLDSGISLLECPYSYALGNGIRDDEWDGFEDIPVALHIEGAFEQTRLVPERIVL